MTGIADKTRHYFRDINASVAMVAGISAIGAFTYGFDSESHERLSLITMLMRQSIGGAP